MTTFNRWPFGRFNWVEGDRDSSFAMDCYIPSATNELILSPLDELR
jgi:hypothetical protein